MTLETRGAPASVARDGCMQHPSEFESRPLGPGLYDRSLRLPAWRLALGRFSTLAASVTGAAYLYWRLSTLDGTGLVGPVLWLAELVAYMSLVFTAFIIWRVPVRVGRPIPLRKGTLDVFITVCGEPPAMVERTVRAALAIDYPHRTWLLNDGWIAGKPGWAEIDALAVRYIVPGFTRTAGARGKAGNLNYALARTDGEFIATIDADHRAHPTFADETLGYFRDPAVAFVTTPQQFEGFADDVLNNSELFFYQVVQPAKDADNAAYSCGNAVVYRRTALKSIGGFSEWNLVEDLHTSYMLHANGWKSVYHPRALTMGTAPETAATFSKQRLTWAMDSFRILLLDCPLFKRGLTIPQRLHYFQTTSNYLFAVTQLGFWLSPALYLLWQLSGAHFASLRDYAVHGLPYFGAVGLFLCAYAGFTAAFRTLTQRVFLSPIFLLAGIKVALSRGRRSVAEVTDKVRLARLSWLVAPSLALVALSLLGVLVALVQRSRAQTMAAAMAGTYVFLLAGLAATALSVSAGRRRRMRRLLRTGIVLALVLTVLLTWQSP